VAAAAETADVHLDEQEMAAEDAGVVEEGEAVANTRSQQHDGDRCGGAMHALSSGTAGATAAAAAAAADADSDHAGNSAAAGALQHAAPVDAAELAAAVSSAGEQYAADKMAALQSADRYVSVLQQHNAQLEQENALLRQQLAAAQQAAGQQPM
jgi:hypothetical protein